MTTIERRYDRNRMVPAMDFERSSRMVPMRLWLEGMAMAWRNDTVRDALHVSNQLDKEQRRDTVTLQRRARLDPTATPLRRIPG